MSCTKCFKQVTFRDEQNPNTPNLMFAQKPYDVNVSPHADYTMFEQLGRRGGTSQKCYRISRGNITRDLPLSEAAIRIYRNLGYSVSVIRCPSEFRPTTPTGPTTPTRPTTPTITRTGTGFNKSQIEQIIEAYHGDDIARLYTIHKEQEDRITSGFNHRVSIEEKVDRANDERAGIHATLSSLGESLQSAKSHRDSIEGKIDTHSLHDLIPSLPPLPPNPFDFEKLLPIILIGGAALFLMGRKK